MLVSMTTDTRLPVSAGSSFETPSASSGFEWSDAGIGAGAMLGLVLLLAGVGGAGAIVRQNRRRTVANA
jgi:hypothetical protein